MKIYAVHGKILVAGLAGLVLLGAAGWMIRGHMVQETFSAWEQPYTLVIDAGHGGMDGGAVSEAGTTEKEINLSIAKRTQALAGLFGIETVMTRENDDSLAYTAGNTIRQNKVADIKMREQIVNDIENPVFISIHLNKFSESQYWGAQVFYSKNHSDGKMLAEKMQDTLIEGISRENKRSEKQAADSIYLMKKLTCPAIIVECGFLSNAREEALLQTDTYHKQLAVCIISGYLQYLSAGAPAGAV